MAQSFLPVLNEVEKASIDERQPLPERYRGLDDEEMDRRIAAAKAALGVAPAHPRPPLSARRGDQVRRLHRRLVQLSRSIAPAAPGRRVHRLLRRALHGRERRRPQRAAPEGDPARPGRRLLDGRHGRRRPPRDLLAGARGDGRRLGRPGHLHQLVGRHQSVRRRARRHRLHVGQRARGARVGVGARRADPVPARPAPRPQHRVQDGRAARPDGGVGSARDRRRPRRRSRRSTRGCCCGRATARSTRASPCSRSRCARGASRRPRDRAPRGAVRRRAGRRRQRLHRVHPQGRARERRPAASGPSAPRSTW